MTRIDDSPPVYMVYHPARGIEDFYKTYEDARKHAGPDAVDYDPESRYTVWTIVKCAPTVRAKYNQHWAYHRSEIEDEINSDQSGEDDRDAYAETAWSMRGWCKYVWSSAYAGMVLPLGREATLTYLSEFFPLTHPLSESGQAAYVDSTPQVAEVGGYALDVAAVRAYARSPSLTLATYLAPAF